MTIKTAIPELNDSQINFLYSLLVNELKLDALQVERLEAMFGFRI